MKMEWRKYINKILLPKRSCRFLFRSENYHVLNSKVRYTELLSMMHTQLCCCCEKGRFRWKVCREGFYVRRQSRGRALETFFCPRETGRTSEEYMLLSASKYTKYTKYNPGCLVLSKAKVSKGVMLLCCPAQLYALIFQVCFFFPTSHCGTLYYYSLQRFISGRRHSGLRTSLYKKS